MKKALNTAFIGIGLALAIFAVIGVIFDIYYGGTFVMQGYSFTRMIAGTVCVGLGFSLPTMIYRRESLAFGLKVLFHMGIGCAVMVATAFAVGWVPDGLPWWYCLLIIAGDIGIAFLIWLGFSHHYRTLASRMNRALQEK
ncbi:MAG: DUF3021 domain-containing protein [Anaerovoracaceae bacterium]|jgi:hypothetical protein